MLNIVISQNGHVSGDKGKIIAYEGQKVSELINIVHPLLPGVKYYIEYKYNNTILRNEIDSNNLVSIEICDAGYVDCKFVAIDLVTNAPVFVSDSWTMIVKESLKIETSHYPCNSEYHYKHRPSTIIAHSNCYSKSCDGFDAFESYEKLRIQLENEETVRFKEIETIRQELESIKTQLGLDKIVASTLNADLIVSTGKYMANSSSIGFPNTNKEYELQVISYSDKHILQIAIEKNSNITYYRNGTINSISIPEWIDWSLLTLPQ